jgi:glycosyltransferase involved in cell wall biosynthesis
MYLRLPKFVSGARALAGRDSSEVAAQARAAAPRRRVAILDLGFIPIYWGRFWEVINQIGDYDYVVFHGDPPAGSGWVAAPGPHNFPNRRIRNRTVRLFGWTAYWQPVVREVLTDSYDAIVLGHEIKFLSNLTLALLWKLRRRKLIYWGFGYHADVGFSFKAESPRLAKRVASAFKDRLAGMADGYLAYTERGRTRMIREVGFDPVRVWVLNQTVDIETQVALHAEASRRSRAEIRRDLGLSDDAVVFLFLGRLIPYKKVEELIEAVRRIRDERLAQTPIRAVIIGYGQEEPALRRLAEGLSDIRFEGAIADQARVAAYLRAADAVVIPGVTGITVTHAFAHGVPLITRAHGMHSPEAEYIRDGENGLMVEGDMTRFVTALGWFADHPDLRRRLAAGALATRASLSIEHMAREFDACVRTVLGDPPRTADR